jgi:hypothetical protein
VIEVAKIEKNKGVVLVRYEDGTEKILPKITLHKNEKGWKESHSIERRVKLGRFTVKV